LNTITSELLPRGRMIPVANGCELHLNVVGEGYPVVFIHGSGPGASGWSNFKQNLKAFVDKGYQCIVPDLIGYGYSSKPDIDYSLDMFTGTLVEALRAIGVERCALVGNSMGGTISMRMALDEPNLVERIILMAPGGLETLDYYRSTEGIVEMIPVLTAPGGLTPASLRQVFSKMLYDSSLVSDRLIEERFTVAQLQNDAIYKRWIIPSLVDEIANIRQPILALWGMNDRFCPVETSMTLMTRVQNARMILQTKCGHWFQLEHQALFEQVVLEFLSE
jgi:4,5:9,10-diseco-3-hydroxy-5,9,17-trioxoandrosta-1(10),2-diene-4-oate hydrolase